MNISGSRRLSARMSPLVDSASDASWSELTDLAYSTKGVVGITSQSDPIQNVGYQIINDLTRDLFFHSSYPRADQKYARYRDIVLDAIDIVFQEEDQPIYRVIKQRALVERKYVKGLIALVRFGFNCISKLI